MNLEKYRNEEMNYIKAHGASIEDERKKNNNNALKHYALIQQISSGGAELNPELQQLVKSVENCEGQDYADFVKAHSALIVRAVQAQNAAERNNNRNDFMKHYKLVNKINGVDID